MWSTISGLTQSVYTAWILSLACAMYGQLLCMFRSTKKGERVWRACAAAHQELWLFAPPGALLGAVDAWNGPARWVLAFYALGLWMWWKYRDWPDENRWKRRSRKAKEAVAERAGRLVVVPAGGSA